MPKTVAVIDGNSLMHRAYHAIQTPMSAPDGTPTNAVFGFMQMLCKFLEKADPDALVCAFDCGKPEFRMAELPTYKAQRPGMDEELRAQFPVIKDLLASMAVPVIEVPGWEGDDILGTIAARNEKLGYASLLVTGDKDACQLATDLTRIVTTKRGLTDVAIMGPDEVMEKYGVTPGQFTDFLGLMGDVSDNIPGVPGIGPKSATKLLESYGDIEGVYEHIGELRGKQREHLEENRDLAYLSRQIATIVCDLDFPLDVEGLAFPSFSVEEVTATFNKYALASPLARVLQFVDAKPYFKAVEVDAGAVLEEVDGAAALDEAIAQGQLIGVDVSEEGELSLFEPSLICAFAFDGATAVMTGRLAADTLARVVREADFAVLDAKRACRLIFPDDTAAEALLTADDVFAMRAFDLGLAGYALDSSLADYTHERLAERFLGAALPVAEGLDATVTLHAAASRLLARELARALDEDGSRNVYENIDRPLVGVLLCMERIGAALDTETLASLGHSSAKEIEALSRQIFDLAGEDFNIDSPKQLQHILFEVLGFKPLKKNQRGYSTNAAVLKELAKTHEIAGLVLRYRELSKIKSTYIDSLPKMRARDGRLHTQFHETVTATGRLSSSNPNLQNIPVRTDFGRQIRECFTPLAPGEVFLAADYSQIELRLLAHFSGDEHLISAFGAGADFHASTAARVFGIDVADVTPQLRSRAKAVNFGIVYGQQAYGLSQSLDIPFDEAKDMIDRYFEAYPGVRSYLDDVVANAEERGYAETLFGRKRHIRELASKNKQQHAVGERTAMNHPMQGTAADIIKLAMIEVARRLREPEGRKLGAHMMLQVHDELDFSVPEENARALGDMVRDVMEGVVELKVPLLVDVCWGPTWAQAH